MSKWNLKELRDAIKEIHGDEQLEKAEPHINSVDWKIRLASYHYYTANNAFSCFFDESSYEKSDAIKLLLSTGDEANKFYEAKIIYEANLIACAQAMHSISDIISHVIHNSLMLPDIDEDNLNLKSINKIVNGPLKDGITRFLGLKEFRYLQDFVNTTKHISLVLSNYSVDAQDNGYPGHGFKFKKFKYKNRNHNEKWGHKFLEEQETISLEYMKIGKLLNKSLIN